jgi:DNA primase
MVNNPGSKSIHALEGFTDFLSLLSLKPHLQNENFLALNSISFSAKAMELLKDFKEVSLFFDHDPAGRNATAEFLKAIPQANDASLFYAGYKDLNDYLRQGRREAIRQEPLQKNTGALDPLREENPKKEIQYKKSLKR